MGPTRGAGDERVWRPRTKTAIAIRVVALLIPVGAAIGAIRLASPALVRPGGPWGVALWVVQAAVLGAVVSRLVDSVSRRLLPLAALYNLSLVFPDRAPSRFGVALRAGTIRRLRTRTEGDGALGDDPLGHDVDVAARRAIEMVLALGRHDRLTRGHTERVRAYADLIGLEMGLDADDRNRLAWGVILHDIGKMTVPPEILNKPDRPTDAEWAVLSGHPAAGERMIEPLSEWLGEWRHAVGQHHERWDGKGYPRGLTGNEIALAGRIAAVADAFDVITSKRSYKQALTNEAARREMVRCAGTQFDPAVVRALLNVSLGRRRPVGGAAWLSDSTLWGATSGTTAGATAASVGVALGTSALVAAAPATSSPASGAAAVVDVVHQDEAPDLASTPVTTTPPPPDRSRDGVGGAASRRPDIDPETDDVAPPPDATPSTTSTSVPARPGTGRPGAATPTSVPRAPVAGSTTTTAPEVVVVPVDGPEPGSGSSGSGTDPSVDDVVEPLVDDVVGTVVDDVVEPVVDDVVEPLVDDVVEPLVDEVVGTVVDDVVEPVVDDVVEPVVDDVVDDIVDPLAGGLGGVLRGVTGGGSSSGGSLLP